ncbi:MAG TPA: PmeII family type II restriction endonuclease [Candidatus Nanoarchaeia archaeon]|nr:PmeII family type II restriction endonuclease [Candidatus Nanoarchaeia archaeon]
MRGIRLSEVEKFVKENIKSFHQNRLKTLEDTKLKDLLKRKNPYLFKAKNIITAQDLVTAFLDAKLSSSEEEIFGDFLEKLAIFIAQKTLNANKSSAHGVDFEYTKKGKRYLVSVKSGLNWGNSSQWKALVNDFQVAVRILKQRRHVREVDCVLGICYGKRKTNFKKGILWEICGQNFWYMISGNETLYTDIIEPLGHQAKQLNEDFNLKKAQIINKFTKTFIDEFCDKKGRISWERLVKLNSENLTPQDKKQLT